MESNRNAPFGTTPGATGATPLGTGGQNVGGAGQGGGQQAVTDRAREVAQEARQKAGEQVRTGLDLGKTRAAQALHGVADSLHQSCETNQDGATRYIKQAGDQVQRAADYLERTDMREMVRHTETFARRQPVLFLGGALALGMAAARFLKSSQRNNQPQDMGYEGAWQGGMQQGMPQGMPQGMQGGAMYDRERPLGGYESGGAYADSSPAGDESASFGASSMGASSMGASGSGMMSAGLAPTAEDADDAARTGMPPFGSSTRDRR